MHKALRVATVVLGVAVVSCAPTPDSEQRFVASKEKLFLAKVDPPSAAQDEGTASDSLDDNQLNQLFGMVQQITSSSNQPYAYIASSTIWRFQPGSDKIIWVCWEDAGWSAEKKWVQNAVEQSWQAASGLRFRGWGACKPGSDGIRIKIAEIGAKVIALGSKLRGKSSGMILNFTFQSWSESCQTMREYCIRTIAVHEFGHAIGFAHEQNSPFAPGECARRRQGPNGDLLLTSYDPESAMNYCNPSWGNYGRLSKKDIIAVQAMYCPTSNPRCKPDV